jgi:hypothetical protein
VGFELLFVRFYWFEWIGVWSFVCDIASGFVVNFDITKVFEIIIFLCYAVLRIITLTATHVHGKLKLI